MLRCEVIVPPPPLPWLVRILSTLAGIAFGLLLAGGCCATRPPVKVITERRDCITEKRPPRPPVEFTGPEGGCPEAFEACLSLPAAGALDLYITRLERWADLAWTACGVRTPERIAP